MLSYLNKCFRGSTGLAVVCLALVTLLAGIAIGQETTGTISGQVTDASGAAIPNASVDVSGGALPQPIRVTSDASGFYQISQVPAGVYTVSGTAQGFSVVKKASVPVNLGRNSRVDFKMEVGQVTESVVVNADAIMVDTSSSSSAINVDKTFFDLIPKGRSFYDLVNLAPGARNEAKTNGFQVDGASGSENTFYLDGMEVTDIQTGVLSNKNRIPVEMVQQVQVKNGVMDAQYGGAMGGVVNAVIRSGSNDFHGEVGFYFNNDSMQARPRPTLELDPTDASLNSIRYFDNKLDDYTTWNQIFSVSGPLIKNRLFLFTAYMPTTTKTNRTVNFLDGVTGNFNRTERTHYLANKLDYVPFSKLRLNASWIWNPNYTQGSLPALQGTSASNANYGLKGSYYAGNTITGQADYIATSKLIFSFRGGYNYNNAVTRYDVNNFTNVYSYANTMFPDLPANLVRTSNAFVSQSSGRQDFNIYTRVNLNADVSYMANWHGQHNIKGGWQTNRLSNSVQNLDYPNGYYSYYWDQSRTCATTQCTGKQRGTYGYYRWYTYGENGDASSDNQGLFIQDTWRVSNRLTLNLGLRAEREFLPSFAKAGIAAAPPIEFNWGKKISPRLGFALDPKGDGKQKISASFGYFYDVMKYEMPRGSFGGALYLTYYYTLDDPNVMLTNQGYPKDPTKLPGRLLEGIDWRIPSNDPNNNTVDPDLKPMKQRMFDLGYDYSFSPTVAGSLRYTNRRLIRTIEDVGTLGPNGEVYYIANPGYGLTVDPATWGAGYPVSPKARRDYDAIEARVDKRFAKNYQFVASYTWSRQYGNYSGLASSDEPSGTTGLGRSSPNVNRYFDLPWVGYNEQGTMSEGRLATDRPHTFKFFGGYTLKSLLGSTTFAPNFVVYSGTPLTTEVDAVTTVPAYPYGRGDLGRTPIFTNLDLNLMHDFTPFKNHESMKVRGEITVFNALNSATATSEVTAMLHPNDGAIAFNEDTDIFKGFNTQSLMKAQDIRPNPMYDKANFFQAPRSLRVQLSFFF